MRTAFEKFSNLQLAANSGDASGLVSDDPRGGFWLRALGSTGRIKSDGNAVGQDTAGGGLALGVDKRFDGVKAGIAFAWGQDKSTLDQNLGSLTLDSGQLAAYARWENLGNTGVYLDASASVGEHKAKTQRAIPLPGQVASASYSAHSYSVSAEVGRDFEQDKVTLTPYLGLNLTQIKRDGVTETGSDANLTVQSNTSNNQRSTIGLRTTWQNTRWTPTLDVAWAHDSGDTRGTLDAAFAALPGQTAFTVDGPSLNRDRLLLKFGVTAWQGKGARLDAGYSGEFARSDRNHTAVVTFRKVW